MKAVEKLIKMNLDGKVICVGLDTDVKKIPKHLLKTSNPVLEFNKEIIKNTSKFAAAYKINFAFYESNGHEGLKNLEKTLSFIPSDILVIADAKRGDIGNTSLMYAKAIYDYFKFDAVTINPYMGEDSVRPFLDYEEKLNFILALTSNPGASDFEKLRSESGKYLFQIVIDKVKSWNTGNNCGIVFGATNFEELKDNINSFDKLSVLLPGVGAQGGSLRDITSLFKENKRINFAVNISRGILYKSEGEDYADAAKTEIIALNSEVNKILSDS